MIMMMTVRMGFGNNRRYLKMKKKEIGKRGSNMGKERGTDPQPLGILFSS